MPVTLKPDFQEYGVTTFPVPLPVAVEISVELLCKVGIEGLLKKSVDVCGVLSETVEL